jgi:hypothetical protein
LAVTEGDELAQRAAVRKPPYPSFAARTAVATVARGRTNWRGEFRGMRSIIPCYFPDPAFYFPVPPSREFARK